MNTPKIGDKISILYNGQRNTLTISEIHGSTMILTEGGFRTSLTWSGNYWILPGNIQLPFQNVSLITETFNVSLTRHELTDVEILIYLDQRSFETACCINKYFHQLCNGPKSNILYRGRIEVHYPKVYEMLKNDNIPDWKYVYSLIIKQSKSNNKRTNSYELAQNGKLIELKILYAMRNSLPSIYGIDLAAENGYLDVLKWVYAQPGGNFPTIRGMNLAAERGHLNVLKWIYEQSTLNGTNPPAAETVSLPNINGANAAAKNGHLDVLKWIYSTSKLTGTPVLPDIDGVDWAAYNGYLDVLKWIYEQTKQLPTVAIAQSVTVHGHLDVLKWMYEHNPNILASRETALVAFDNKRLDVVKWLISKGIVPAGLTISKLALY